MPPLTEIDPEVRDSPVYWFVVLDTAKDQGDFRAAARAQHELERLGVRVTYRRRPRREAAHAV